MKFWQLVSICRERPDILRQILQADKRKRYYKTFLMFDELVEKQEREALDEIVPDELVLVVLKDDTRQLYISNGYLRIQPLGISDEETSILSAYQRFGGRILEEVLEKGLVAI